MAISSTRNTIISKNEIQYHNIHDDIPQLNIGTKDKIIQDDGHNCGVWIVMYVIAFINNEYLLFDQENNSPAQVVNDNIEAARVCIFELIMRNKECPQDRRDGGYVGDTEKQGKPPGESEWT